MKLPIKNRWAPALAVFLLTAASYAQWSNPAEDVPAYHPSAPLKVEHAAANFVGRQTDRGELPLSVAGARLQEAGCQRYPAWSYQLPCNCRCDRALGHTRSLRSCFEGMHGTECSNLRPGRVLRLCADQAGQDSGTDSGRYCAA